MRQYYLYLETEGLEDTIKASIKSCLTGIKVIKLNLSGLFLLLPIVNWYTYEMAKIGDKSPFLPMVVGTILLLAMIGFCIWFMRKRKIELDNLNEILK